MISVSRFGMVATALALTFTACGDDPSGPPPDTWGGIKAIYR